MSEAVAPERHLALGRLRLAVADGAHDGEKDRRVLAPHGGISLPEVFLASERKARKLGTHGIDGSGKLTVLQGNNRHMPSSQHITYNMVTT